MKKLLIISFVTFLTTINVALAVTTAPTQNPSANNNEITVDSQSQKQPRNKAMLKSLNDKVSYAMGLETGKTFKKNNVEINPKLFALGMDDAMTGKKPLLHPTEQKTVLDEFQKQSIIKLQTKYEKNAVKNRQMGAVFMAKMRKQQAVKCLPSGLCYKQLHPGDGKRIPTENDIVVVDYEGKLINGEVFDSTYKRGQAATFPVGGVIKGWQQALLKMNVGSTWELYVPPKLAYGRRGVPGVIGPNETLIFKVHLIAIKR